MTRVSLLLLTVALSAGAADTNRQIFQVNGVVVGVEPDGKTVRIKHEAIPGYMGAMTMPFEVKDTNELAGLAGGDAVAFRLIVTTNDGWIDQIQKRGAPVINIPLNSGMTVTRDVEPLNEGDLVPDYTFTSELGRRIHVWQFRGKALAINFLFTRCPFPNFCPLMANNFAEVQRKLLAQKDGPTNWQLLTISFDPGFDNPAVLQAYANSHGYDPAHWSFATGKLADITEFGDLFGLQFWREADGTVSHNLRTIIVDPAGRMREIFVGNQWAVDEVVREMVKAAGVK